MSSHIHELWNDLGLPEEYPELDPEAILSRVEAALEQEEAASAPPEGPRQNSMKKKMKWAVLLAATLALTTGAALAAAYQMGVLDLFFTRGGRQRGGALCTGHHQKRGKRGLPPDGGQYAL